MKKCILFIFSFIVIITICIVPSFALLGSTPTEGQTVYALQSISNGLYKPYEIKYTEITTVPSAGNQTKNPDIQGFLYNMFGTELSSVGDNSGTYYYNLIGGSQIKITFNADTSVMNAYLINESNLSYYICSMMYDQNMCDFAIFVGTDGKIYVGQFYTSTTFTSVNALTAPLWGNIIIPSTYNSENIYEDGYNEGYEQGYKDGGSASAEEAYNKGYLAGQDTDGIVTSAIQGFFDSMVNFFTPFLQIGVGRLTLYSLLGIVLTACVVMIIVKIIRG